MLEEPMAPIVELTASSTHHVICNKCSQTICEIGDVDVQRGHIIITNVDKVFELIFIAQ